jgi:hypothetical protein
MAFLVLAVVLALLLVLNPALDPAAARQGLAAALSSWPR